MKKISAERALPRHLGFSGSLQDAEISENVSTNEEISRLTPGAADPNKREWGFRWNYEEAGGGQDRTRRGHGARGKTEHWVAVFVLPGGWVAIGVLCTGPDVMCFETKVGVLDHNEAMSSVP